MKNFLVRWATLGRRWVRRNPYRAAVWVLVCANLAVTVEGVVFVLRPDLYRAPVVEPGEISAPSPDPSRGPAGGTKRDFSPEPVPDRFRRLFAGSVFTAAGSGDHRDGSAEPSDRADSERLGSSPGTSDRENLNLDVMGWVSDTTSVRVLVRDRGRDRTFTLEPGDTVPGRELRLESTTGTGARFRRPGGRVLEGSLSSAATREGETQ